MASARDCNAVRLVSLPIGPRAHIASLTMAVYPLRPVVGIPEVLVSVLYCLIGPGLVVPSAARFLSRGNLTVTEDGMIAESSTLLRVYMWPPAVLSFRNASSVDAALLLNAEAKSIL